MTGKILLVGFGPGSEAHMTVRARAAIAEADVIIGYSTYIKLVKDLLDGKEVIRKGMTEEIDRCVEAYEQARQGKIVALISSGDVGVYGMAGPTFEVLFQSGWAPGSGVEVEVVPGSTALSACAALVGAPLTHDFCSISLSDLLTPWPVIARRLDAAGRADFVVALYNPKSGRRTRQIVQAQRILLRHRRPHTPVAVVKSAYRKRQNIQMTTLENMADCDIGMLTTVLIGNNSTYVRDGVMITPRGYANKYTNLTGKALDGEQAGRSLNMGLEGWKSCVRKYLDEHPDATLRNAAAYFDAPLGEILDAIAATPEAGSYHAAAIAEDRLLDAVLASEHWGKLRAVVRSRTGAVAELLFESPHFEHKGAWLNLVTGQFHLHIQWASVRRGWFVQGGGGRAAGVYFVDKGGEPVFYLLLVKAPDGTVPPSGWDAFETARQQLARVSQ